MVSSDRASRSVRIDRYRAVLPFDLESNVEAQSSSSGDNVITTPEDVAFISLDLDCVFRLWNWHEQRTRIAVSHSCRVSLPRGSKSSSIPRFRDVAARSGVIMLWCSTWAVFEQSELRSPSFEPKMSWKVVDLRLVELQEST